MFTFTEIKSWFLAHFLKRYVQPDNRKPRKYPEAPFNVDLPRHIDHYWDRTSDPDFVEIDEKVKTAVANLRKVSYE